MEAEEFITSHEAAKRLGVAPLTLRQRVRRGELPVFLDPLDSRRRLVRATDLESLRTIRPVRREQLAGSPAA